MLAPMTTTATPASDIAARFATDLRAVLSMARDLLAGAGLVRRDLHARTARHVRIAEAMARRVVLLLAVTFDITPLSPKAQPQQTRKQAPRQTGIAAISVAMFDPWSAKPPSDWSVLQGRSEPDALVSPARLRARLQAVDRVLDDPAPMARRMAAWMRRRAVRAAAEIAQRSRPEAFWVCRLGRPPGLEGRCRQISPGIRDALTALSARAREAYPPP